MLSNSIYSHMFSYTNNYKIYPLEFMKLHTKFCTLNVYFKFNKPKSYEKIKKLKFYEKLINLITIVVYNCCFTSCL